MATAFLAASGTAACSGSAEEGSDDTVDAKEEGAPAIGTAQEALGRSTFPGTGASGSSCGAPPLQCAGTKYQNRAIYPGCSVTCSAGQTSMCLAGDCFFGRAPSCTCQSLYAQ
jgi:hypothetical protein